MYVNMIRFTAVANIPVLLLMLAAFWYLLVLPLHRKRRDGAQSRLAYSIHLANGCALLLLCLFCFLLPLLFDQETDWHGMLFLDSGALILALAIVMHYSSRKDAEVFRKYLRFRLGSLVAAGIGAFMSGMYWLWYMPEPTGIRAVSSVLAVLGILAGELVFIGSNKWEFMPRDPE